MDIKIRKNKSNVYLMELSGSIDLHSSDQLKDLVMKMIKNKVERFIISLKDIETVNSSGIGALSYVSSTLKKLNCPLVIIVPEGPALQALEVTRLKGYFTIASSLEEAVPLATAGFNEELQLK